MRRLGLMLVLWGLPFTEGFAQDFPKPIIEDSYNIIGFQYGETELNQKAIEMMKMHFNAFSQIDSLDNYFIIAESWMCGKEMENFPDIGLLRAKKVIEYFKDSLGYDGFEFYISHRNFHVNVDCDNVNGIFLHLRPICD